ncbi:MAG TPA: GNAT family N-acetyltransferase [Chloroflexota bacterium]|jgi:predicted N-acetyltransferase YhbS|nr:GNAT family N-acetyltransferase [Chloroflexota bacterium]
MDRGVATLRQGEIEAVVDLLDDASAFDRFPLQQVLEHTLEDAGFDPELLLGVREGDRLIAGAVGVTRTEVGHVKIFAVHPERRRQGIGSALLAEVEARLAARGAQTVRFFADAPHYLRPGVDFRDTAFVSFLERRRYAPRRAVCNMAADLAAARLDTAADEARLGADGFEIRRLAQADAAAFEEYMLERWTPSWRTEAMRSLRREPVSSHVALREGRIVGFASHSVSGPGQFGPMGTNQELRGQGVGAVLLKRCLADQREAGFAECDIQWVGPKGFYADHVGARISRCFWQYERGLMVDA